MSVKIGIRVSRDRKINCITKSKDLYVHRSGKRGTYLYCKQTIVLDKYIAFQ